MRPPRFIANFDSSTAMVRATANFLRGRDFPALGLSPLLKPLAARANLLPQPVRRRIYIFSGWNESIPARRVRKAKSEKVSRWVAGEYPDRTYPAVAIGSSNGAAVHLFCALGIPWLPQTFLIPVRQSVHPDEPRAALKIGEKPGRALLDANPDLQLHHMHDANQDRLMVKTMTYFRVKRRRLGDEYERFLEERLPPGGTIVVMDCERTWPTTTVGDRHFFQHGALGGATEAEFHEGSERVEDYLRRYGSHLRRWESTVPDGRSPEAEWGFEPSLLEDITRIARERRYKVRYLRFPEPQALSPAVADLHRWWYRKQGVPDARLLVESFVVLEPFWALRTGSVPFWMEFNMEPSLEALNDYLDESGGFDEIHAMLFNHGVEAVGLPSIDEWEKALARAGKRWSWVGAEPPEFPPDYAQFSRYHTEVQKLPGRFDLPEPLSLRDVDEFFDDNGDRYRVNWVREHPQSAA